MTWVYTIPTWLFFTGVVLLMAALSIAGLLLYWRLVPEREDLTHNDVAGPVVGAAGTILAVVLSFLLVSVWQQYDGAAATVEQEAGAVADLYHGSSNFPQPTRGALQAALRTYVDVVVTQEWPAMRSGGRSAAARHASLATFRIVAGYRPQTPTQQTLQQAALNDAHTIQDARRDRLFANQQGIPTVFWGGILFLWIVTIGLCYIFRVRNHAMHMVMTAALSAIIATIFVLIAEFDYPFRGDDQIPPSAFVMLRQTLPSLTESD